VKNRRDVRRHFALAAGCLAACIFGNAPAGAQEITLRAANAFQEGTYYARNFEAFIKKINEDGKGLVHINYIGGPKAIPTFQLANAIKTGVVDLGNTTTSYTASIVPEGQVLNYTNLTMAEMRHDGVMDYLNKIFLEKGLYYYARTGEGMHYYIYTNKKVENGNLAGLKIRSAPIYQNFFRKMGITGVEIAPGEVYTALQNHVVDGYAWPLIGIFDFNWQEMTKYRVEPGFYAVELGVIFNADTWKKLTPQQRALFEKERVWLEHLAVEAIKKDIPNEIKRQQAAGIQIIKLDDVRAKAMLKTAYSAAWDEIVALSPKDGAKLRTMMEPK
jgi:TRAP-type transport system periplasmic protein